MSKNRYINTKIWSDNYFINLDPVEKLLFLYILTNEKTNICGIYELPLKIMSVETGVEKEMIEKILKRFEEQDKIKYENGWIGIKNFIKHQKVSNNKDDKINIGIEKSFNEAPEFMKKWVLNKDLIPLKPPPTPLNYLNLNLNYNTNINDVNEIYSLYPTRDVNNNNRCTSKSNNDKKKIASLLKQHTKDDLIKRMTFYLKECETKKTYLKNFSVFLNNLPEIVEENKQEQYEFHDDLGEILRKKGLK